MRLKVDVSDVLRWAKFAEEQVRAGKPQIASALNQLGDSVSRNLAIDLSRTINMPVDQVRGMMEIKRATSRDLNYSVDSSRLMDQRLVPMRAMPRREFPRREEPFAASELVNVITFGDDKVCKMCERIAENGPYTIEVARAMIPHHPHCRCSLEPFRPAGRLPVRFATEFGAAPRTETFSVPQLVAKLLLESTFKLSVRR